MTKNEVTALLGISSRSLERYAAQGRIRARRVKGKTGIIADYAPDDVERLKIELESLITAAPRPDDATSATGATTALARLPLSVKAPLATTDTPKRDRGDKAEPTPTEVGAKWLLTLEEAAIMTGLSKGRIRAAIGAEELKAGRVGRAFRVRPDDVKEWLKQLF